MRLIWFPYAGGGAGGFRPLLSLLSMDIAVDAIQLPGRENRYGLSPINDFDVVMDMVTAAVDCSGDIPVVFWGHSMGALIAFELCLRLEARRSALPAKLILSGSKPPSVPDDRNFAGLPDDGFIEAIQGLNGTPDDLLSNPEIASVFLPVLRADFTVAKAARAKIEGVVDLPIVVLGGDRDPHVTADDLAKWQAHTKKPISVKIFPGDHFFIHQNMELVVAYTLSRIGTMINSHQFSARLKSGNAFPPGGR